MPGNQSEQADHVQCGALRNRRKQIAMGCQGDRQICFELFDRLCGTPR